jgi:hypothetical protein
LLLARPGAAGNSLSSIARRSRKRSIGRLVVAWTILVVAGMSGKPPESAISR